MDKIYLVNAYFPYEGSEPLFAFKDEEEAKEVLDSLNNYHAWEPDRRTDKEAFNLWKGNHPDQRYNYCESYEISEVPIYQRPTES